MKKLLSILIIVLFSSSANAYLLIPFPESHCIKYNPETGKYYLKGVLRSPSPGDPGTTYAYKSYKYSYFDYTTSTIVDVNTKTYLFVQNPTTLVWVKTLSQPTFTPITSSTFPFSTIGYVIFYELDIPGFDPSQCYNMTILSDYDVKECDPTFAPWAGIDPTIEHDWYAYDPFTSAYGFYGRVFTSSPHRVCPCGDYQESICNSNFTIKNHLRTSSTSSTIITVPDKSVQVELDEFHPLSSYTINYGDGTGSHPYSPTSTYIYALPGTYNICITEITPNNQMCTTCYSICIGTTYSVALPNLPNPTSPSEGIVNPLDTTAPCNSNFVADITLHTDPSHSVPGAGFLIPDRSISISLDEYHASSTYEVDYGDGTGPHPYVAPPLFYTYAMPGTYNVCITEIKANGERCKTCYNFCIGVSFSTYGSSGSNPGQKRTENNSLTFTSEKPTTISIAPNPTQNSATLSLELAQKENVQVAIIDMTGKKVADVFNGALEEGAQKININAINLSSGLYQVQVMIGNKITSHKLSVVK